MIYNRNTKKIEHENEYKTKTLYFLYNTIPGRILLNLVIARPWFSNLRAIYQKSRFSHKDIEPFAKKYGIVLENGEDFKSFNDFFIRKREITINDFSENALLSIADGKMRYYNIGEDLKLTIKNSIYDLEDILADSEKAKKYKGGTCIVIRLSVDDYHRYHYIDNGRLISTKKIRGKLHTIRSISEKYMVYTHNTRVVNLLDTENMGEVAMIEVGALLVGKIVNENNTTFSKMQEKGHFEFGGSTIVLLFDSQIKFDDDIIEMNEKNIEIKVKAGERIGIIC